MLDDDNAKHSTGRRISLGAVAVVSVAVASSAIVGTVAPQSSRGA